MNIFCRRCNTHHEFSTVEMERIIYTLQLLDEQRHALALQTFNAIAASGPEGAETYPSDEYRADCLITLLAASTDVFEGRVDELTNKAEPDATMPPDFHFEGDLNRLVCDYCPSKINRWQVVAVLQRVGERCRGKHQAEPLTRDEQIQETLNRR